MAVREVRLFGDPVLRTKTKEVTDFGPELHRLVKDMIDTMRQTQGVGLAAPQIGVELRIFVFEVSGEVGHIINPVLENSDEKLEPTEEGCLSIPGIAYPVIRSARTVATGVDMYGKALRLEVDQLLARVFQHESDHLDGVLFIDRLNKDDKRKAMTTLNAVDYQTKLDQTRSQRRGALGSAFGAN